MPRKKSAPNAQPAAEPSDTPAASGLPVESRRSAWSDPDQFVSNSVASVRGNLDRWVSDATTFAQEQPQRALLSALVTGYALHALPTTRIVGSAVRLALALVKPAALLYGAAKLWEKTQGRSGKD